MKKGSHLSPETREKMREAHLGTHHSEETREKMREAKRGEKNHNFGTHPSPATIEKRRQALLGTHHTLATIEKMREAHLGEKNPFFGKHHTPAAIEKNRQANLGKHLSPTTIEKMSGEKNHNWQGGSSFEPYSTAWTEDLKEAIRKRDRYICQLCGKKQEELAEKLQKKLHIHHIDYDKKNLDPENLISLCHSCHMKTNHNREEWKLYFQSRKRS